MRNLIRNLVAMILTAVTIAVIFGIPTAVSAKVESYETSYEMDLSAYSDETQWKYYLYTQMTLRGAVYAEYDVFRNVIELESGWNHYYEGEVLQNFEGSPDFGTCQIHSPSWEDTLTNLGIDMYDEYGNLDGCIYIYFNYGIEQWVAYTTNY